MTSFHAKVTDFYAGGDLFNLLNKFETFGEDNLRVYAAQLVVALEAVHSLGYVHLDVEPANIFLDTRGRLHLADFGSAEKLDTGDGCTGRAPAVSADKLLQLQLAAGKIEYAAPEVVRGEDFGQCEIIPTEDLLEDADGVKQLISALLDALAFC